ncbi:MAG: TonB-dependent receptor [Bacteroidetes bacterium HGW-Bacteroidetes-1]|jgi:outer membrane cobalamin receptor|nr:MAG: TonB-dependent receptor [Bacteroidetes bacterium HGW-Bacteroidetes-1]
MLKHFQLLFLLLFLLIHQISYSQQIKGFIYESVNGDTIALPGVNIFWEGTQKGTVSDARGAFTLSGQKGAHNVIFSFVGYANDTLHFHESTKPLIHIMSQPLTLNEVEITTHAKTSFVSRLSTVNATTITSGELQRAACCNLSESFETSASVDVSYSDAVTGAKQIEMLGLAGIYTQMMSENIPNLRGLATSFGLGYVPGSWMESIQVSKGTSSVLNGYESISGQINVEYKKPADSERFFLNLYQSHSGRSEGNFNTRLNITKNLKTMLLGHISTSSSRHDDNHDGFLDEPLYTQYNFFNRWEFSLPQFEFQFGIKALKEDRRGGQLSFDVSLPRDSNNGYGVELLTDRVETFLKTGYVFANRPATSLGIQQQFTYHQLSSFFGLNDYDANQISYYGNALFQSFIGNTQHAYTTGISLVYDQYEEQLNDSLFGRTEKVPGVFFQYTYSDGEKINLIAGLRADHHNQFGLFITPRLHFRYSFNAHTILRASAGKGFRSTNVLAENTSMLASSRRIVFLNSPRMEEAWNYGINISKHIDIGNRELSINADLYRTDFINQVIVDRDSDVNMIQIYNLNGSSYSNSFQLEGNYELIKGLDVTAAFRINDVKMTFDETLLEKPLVNKYKGLLSLSYATNLKKWQFDLTSQFNGQTRLPSTDGYPEIHQRETASPAYTIIHAQITKFYRHWNIYLGGENLTNYKQKHPVIAAENPFGNHFDSSMIWGPITGVKVYAGLRYTLE